MLGIEFGPRETAFLVDLLLAFVCGFFIGAERDLKGKPAGVSTQTLVISASMMFAYMSHTIFPADATRIAAQVVSGVGFLGAGLIIKSSDNKRVDNVTTAASIWYGAAIGMALGFNYHAIALTAAGYAVLVTSIPNMRRPIKSKLQNTKAKHRAKKKASIMPEYETREMQLRLDVEKS
ncbi:MAG: putative magnesium transporter-C family protein [Candidatus Saccharibacteria bacterium]|nr:putative magnesium transporter-C family protein [Candidatus Saccharibacteria bacterium]